jgi:hypothetical protein
MKPETYKNCNSSQTVDIRKVSQPTIGRCIPDPTAPHGFRFVKDPPPGSIKRTWRPRWK